MKFKKYNKKKTTLILINIFVCLLNTTYANKNQIIQIYSTYQKINALTNKITFKEHVRLKHKNIKLHADTITIIYSKNDQAISILEAHGNPAILYHTQKPGCSIISAESLSMYYDSISNTITFSGNVCIKQSHNSIHSDNIIYSINQKKIQATSNNKGNTNAIISLIN